MRYFEVNIITESHYEYGRVFPDLYEEVGRQAVVFIDACGDREIPWEGKDRRWQRRIFVITKDNRTNKADALDFARQACKIWKITDVLDWQTEEPLLAGDNSFIKPSQGNGTVLQKSDLFEFYNLIRTKNVFQDWIVVERSRRKDCMMAADSTSYAQSLTTELKRIFSSCDSKKTKNDEVQIPMHYLVEGCNLTDSHEAVEVLLEGLRLARRLPSPHAFQINFDKIMGMYFQHGYHDGEVITQMNESLAFALAGNVLVLEYGRFDKGSSYDEHDYATFCRFVKMLRPHLNTTLVIFTIPQNNPDLEKRIRKLMATPIVSIRPNAKTDLSSMSIDDAWNQLTKLVTAKGMKPDASLHKMLENHIKNQDPASLDELYAAWRRKDIIERSFPAYNLELKASLEIRDQQEPNAMARLDELIGLSHVKQQIKDILARFKMNREVARAGLPIQPFSMHMAFVGAPGTGKTEVARLCGDILKEAGILSEGRLIAVSAPRIYGVTELFERARGSILFVDEAYGIAWWQIPEFVACMEEYREDTVVILAGYESEMEGLMSLNPGFRSRIGFTIKFPDYTTDELMEIYELMCHRAQLNLTSNARRMVRDLLARNGRRDDQGNARYVRKLFEDTVGAQQVRIASKYTSSKEISGKELGVIRAKDVAKAGKLDNLQSGPSGREQLASLIGLDEVKQLVDDRIDFMRMQQARRDRGLPAANVPIHLAFLGAPGTGKTEVARCLGRILREEGVLSVGDFYEMTGNALVSSKPGQSALLARTLFAKARGSVVFIDEAYSLMDGSSEVITTIISEMERLRDDVVVIFAGYKDEIEMLLESNPGFASRVGARIVFPDYSPSELVQILESMASNQELHFDSEAHEKAYEIMECVSKQKNFGNARFARNLLENALLHQSSRLAARYTGKTQPTAEELSELLPEDFEWQLPATKQLVGFSSM